MSSGHARLIKGASLQCNARTHVKTDHALQVFDKMPMAPRHVLEWPKTPDGGLFRRIRGWCGYLDKRGNLLVQVLQNPNSGQEINDIIS